MVNIESKYFPIIPLHILEMNMNRESYCVMSKERDYNPETIGFIWFDHNHINFICNGTGTEEADFIFRLKYSDVNDFDEP